MWMPKSGRWLKKVSNQVWIFIIVGVLNVDIGWCERPMFSSGGDRRELNNARQTVHYHGQRSKQNAGQLCVRVHVRALPVCGKCVRVSLHFCMCMHCVCVWGHTILLGWFNLTLLSNVMILRLHILVRNTIVEHCHHRGQLHWFNKIAIQARAQVVADKEAVGLSRVHMHESKCILSLRDNCLFCC